MKKCPKCKRVLSIRGFYNSKQTRDGVMGWCKRCHGASNCARAKRPESKAKAKLRYAALSEVERKERRRKQEEAHKRYRESPKGRAKCRANRSRAEVKRRENARRIFKLFGITEEQYTKLSSAQEFKCAICKTHRDKLEKALAVDHEHASGKVRGLLCIACNIALGNFKENVGRLRAAILYLRAHGK